MQTIASPDTNGEKGSTLTLLYLWVGTQSSLPSLCIGLFPKLQQATVELQVGCLIANCKMQKLNVLMRKPQVYIAAVDSQTTNLQSTVCREYWIHSTVTLWCVVSSCRRSVGSLLSTRRPESQLNHHQWLPQWHDSKPGGDNTIDSIGQRLLVAGTQSHELYILCFYFLLVDNDNDGGFTNLTVINFVIMLMIHFRKLARGKNRSPIKSLDQFSYSVL